MHRGSRILLLLFGLTFFLVAAACASQLRLQRDSQLQDRLVEVHIVGINDISRAEWESYKLEDYWKPKDTFRQEWMGRGVVKVIQLRPGVADEYLFEKTDPIWKDWSEYWEPNKVDWLVVLADMHAIGASSVSDASAWRQLVKAKKNQWFLVELTPDRMYVSPSKGPGK